MRLFILSLLGFLAASAWAQEEPEPRILPSAEAGTDADAAERIAPDEFEWLRSEGFDTVICPFRDRIDYEPGEVECGLIKVPENREVAGSRTIELHFVHIPARGEDEDGNEVETRDDPVIYLTGGPGVTVEGYVERLKDHPLVGQRDLYILEQRGIGNSGDFCPFFGARNRAGQIQADFEDSQRAMFDQLRACIEGAKARGVDVTGYHTFENARDVRALRLALGLDDWNVWGISYGSVLGQAYMKVDPEGIRAAVIDAIVPLDLENLMRIPHWHTQNLERLFGACNEQEECRGAFSSLATRYPEAIETMTENPVSLEVEASERYPTGEVHLFQDLIAGLPFSLLYEQSNHPAIPAIIDGLVRAVETRDETFFRAIALAEQGGGPGVSMGMSTTVRCLDGYVDRWAENAPDDFRAYPVLARAFGSLSVIEEAPALCREVGLAPRDARQFELIETDLPVVVANGALDPITPVPLAESIMPGLENGHLVVFPHAGHGPTRSLDCAGDFLNGYFDDPLAELDMSCAEDGEEAAEYIGSYFRTQAAPRGLLMHAEDEDRLRAHIGWGGASAGISLVGLVVIVLAWVARRINRRTLEPAGGSRLLVFLATLAATAYAGGLAAAVKATTDITEAMVLFGLVPVAGVVAWLAPLAGLLGAAGLVQTWRYRAAVETATTLGLMLVSLAVISLSAFGFVWDLWPF